MADAAGASSGGGAGVLPRGLPKAALKVEAELWAVEDFQADRQEEAKLHRCLPLAQATQEEVQVLACHSQTQAKGTNIAFGPSTLITHRSGRNTGRSTPRQPKSWKVRPSVGAMQPFRDWYALIRDHILAGKQGDGRVLRELLHESIPLSFSRLKAFPCMKGLPANLVWVTNALWTSVSRHVTNSFRNSMKSLVIREELHGLELLRIMYICYENGADEVEVADLGALHDVPQCADSSELQVYLGERLSIVQGEGADLPLPRHLRTLLLKMIPSDVHADATNMNILRKPYVDIVHDLQTEASRWDDSKVAKHNVQRSFASLPGPKHRVHALTSEHDEDAQKSEPQNAVEDPVVERLDLVCANLEKLAQQRS